MRALAVLVGALPGAVAGADAMDRGTIERLGRRGRVALRIGLRVLSLALVALALVLPASGAAPARAATSAQGVRSVSIYTGYGFDTCSAPSLTTLNAWLTSPFRAVGIYIGGVNRACKDGRLSSSWVSGAQALGWNLIPIYVGLQAPCVSDTDLALIKPASAASQGRAAASDAVTRAQLFGLAPGSPVYYDMEGYATKDPGCSQSVREFVSAWSAALHDAGYVAGFYSSAASGIRDMVPLTTLDGATPPDDIWIANWNGKEGVYGDPYIADDYWHNHQRLHQYRGGHKETHGGVTINIDSNYLDGAVAGVGSAPPPPPPPPPPPTTTTTGTTPFVPGGAVSSSDGLATASWPDGSFSVPVTVSLTPSTLRQASGGFGAGSYVLQLAFVDSGNGSPVASSLAPVDVHVQGPSADLVIGYSSDGASWEPIAKLSTPSLPSGATRGYIANADGSVDILTTVPGFFGLLKDVGPPSAPSDVRGRISGGSLLLRWRPSLDNSREVALYQVTLDGTPLATTGGRASGTSVRAFRSRARSVFRIVAADAAGNASAPSRAVVVIRTARPRGLPQRVPGWAYRMLTWQQGGKSGPRPKGAPRHLPRWYWRWAEWRTHPFSIA